MFLFFSDLENEPERFINKLLSLSPTSTLAQLANGGYVWNSLKKSLEASKILSPIIEKSPNPNFFGVLILCQCLFETKVIRGRLSTVDLLILTSLV
jgi:hypothetical protein